MTLADLLNTLESADMLRIIKGDEFENDVKMYGTQTNMISWS